MILCVNVCLLFVVGAQVAVDCLPEGAVGSGFAIMLTQWNLIHSKLSQCL